MMRYYTLSVIEDAFRRQDPELTETEIKEKAKKIHSQLNTLDISWRRSNKKFYRMNEFRNIGS
ncbi:hypothetical protein [Sporomusa rhizae]|uniref:hypothetical protein n=1 Tax=Sporomusa rhizae TaxID=357999 RepID=UPI00352A1F1B